MKEQIREILDKVDTEINWCGCFEGDICNCYPKAREEATKQLVEYFNSLLPQGDKEGLVKADYIDKKCGEDVFGIATDYANGESKFSELVDNINYRCDETAKAQKALSYSIKDNKIKKVIEFLASKSYPEDEGLEFYLENEEWESLKKELLNETD